VAEKLIVIGGGARSGKSRFALRLALQLGSRPGFIATAQAHDDEMRMRIERHRLERDERFRTLEATTDLGPALAQCRDCDVVVIDCLTLLLSNLLLAEPEPPGAHTEARVEAALQNSVAALSDHPGRLIVVTNEVGMGIVPMSPLGRVFRDLSGRANQLFAARADELYFAALGVVLRLRPEPVQVQPSSLS
jgi:adenosylcobinamide kinase / adenosylcobinamide-phosphate guanylyltransferase